MTHLAHVCLRTGINQAPRDLINRLCHKMVTSDTTFSHSRYDVNDAPTVFDLQASPEDSTQIIISNDLILCLMELM